MIRAPSPPRPIQFLHSFQSSCITTAIRTSHRLFPNHEPCTTTRSWSQPSNVHGYFCALPARIHPACCETHNWYCQVFARAAETRPALLPASKSTRVATLTTTKSRDQTSLRPYASVSPLAHSSCRRWGSCSAMQMSVRRRRRRCPRPHCPSRHRCARTAGCPPSRCAPRPLSTLGPHHCCPCSPAYTAASGNETHSRHRVKSHLFCTRCQLL
ncbi:hypothetical protein BKA66DRAFT_177333 [Pyrenochaeta sp. MPI-SDFR-AT-0127]|nr:hypothetical protein BKA66DRAFT_177333 [Pyrenochaeta sp. MPI-SDFR-AT-0127]